MCGMTFLKCVSPLQNFIRSYKLSEMSNWGASKSTFVLVCGDTRAKTKFLLKTRNVCRVSVVVGGVSCIDVLRPCRVGGGGGGGGGGCVCVCVCVCVCYVSLCDAQLSLPDAMVPQGTDISNLVHVRPPSPRLHP